MALVSKAAAGRVPVYSLPSGKAALIAWLAQQVTTLPALDIKSFESRWSDAVEAVQQDNAEVVRICLAELPELRAARDVENRCLLPLAVSFGALGSVKGILSAGATRHLQDDDGRTASDLALTADSFDPNYSIIRIDRNYSKCSVDLRYPIINFVLN